MVRASTYTLKFSEVIRLVSKYIDESDTLEDYPCKIKRLQAVPGEDGLNLVATVESFEVSLRQGDAEST